MAIWKTIMKERIIFMSVKRRFFFGISVDVSFSNNLSPGVEKFLFSRPTRSGTQKTSVQNQSVRPLKTQLEILLFVLH